MSKKTSTKNYSREFRVKAVKLVTERGYTLEQLAILLIYISTYRQKTLQ